MENFKIDLFIKENKGKSFPEFEKLSENECLLLKQALFKKLQLNVFDNDVIELLNLLRKTSIIVPNINADSESFNLQEIINTIITSEVNYVNVNWYQFNDIDRFKVKDLNDYFKYIWYPGPDDIEIFPNDLSWMILIDATGSVFIYKFSQLVVVL